MTKPEAIEVHCAHSAMIPLADLKPNPKNPNQHPFEQVKLLAEIIQRNGWRSPITVSKLSGMVVKGHGRLSAARMILAELVPVDYQHYETEADELADMVADNRIAELAEIDNDLLLELLNEMSEDGSYSMEALGFTDDAKELLETKMMTIDDFVTDDFELPEEVFDEDKEQMTRVTLFVSATARSTVLKKLRDFSEELTEKHMRVVK